jgi:hypothetical protein
MKSKRMRSAGHVARMGRRMTRLGYWGKPEIKGFLGRWVYNVRTDLGEVGYGDVDWWWW